MTHVKTHTWHDGALAPPKSLPRGLVTSIGDAITVLYMRASFDTDSLYSKSFRTRLDGLKGCPDAYSRSELWTVASEGVIVTTPEERLRDYAGKHINERRFSWPHSEMVGLLSIRVPTDMQDKDASSSDKGFH